MVLSCAKTKPCGDFLREPCGNLAATPVLPMLLATAAADSAAAASAAAGGGCWQLQPMQFPIVAVAARYCWGGGGLSESHLTGPCGDLAGTLR